ncbi:MAG: hypothetical protein U9Q07_07995 [Planctomycetota bacterium]|nr:hypothetical protein [Planctomycetota bacterium]
MIETTLAFLGPIGAPEALIVLIVFAIPIVLAIKFFRLMLRNKNENIRLRLEVGKLADELEQTRKQEGTAGCDSPV